MSLQAPTVRRSTAYGGSKRRIRRRSLELSDADVDDDGKPDDDFALTGIAMEALQTEGGTG